MRFGDDSEPVHAMTSDGLLWSGDALVGDLEMMSLLQVGEGNAGTTNNNSPSLVDSGSFAIDSGNIVESMSEAQLMDALISARHTAPAATEQRDHSAEYLDAPRWGSQPQYRQMPPSVTQQPPPPPSYSPSSSHQQAPWVPQQDLPPLLSAAFISQGSRGHQSHNPVAPPHHQQQQQQGQAYHQGPSRGFSTPHSNMGGGHASHGHHNNRGGRGGGRGGGGGGGGYRTLWAQVNKVAKGGRLEDDASRPCTVEDLIHIILTLPHGEASVPHIAPGLPNLDSSAFAALLKELNKQGLQHRCIEIFDWLRGLPPSHELYRLCGEINHLHLKSCSTFPSVRH